MTQRNVERLVLLAVVALAVLLIVKFCAAPIEAAGVSAAYLGPLPDPPPYHQTTYKDSREFPFPRAMLPCYTTPPDAIDCILRPITLPKEAQ